jgi:hypothetical protein
MGMCPAPAPHGGVLVDDIDSPAGPQGLGAELILTADAEVIPGVPDADEEDEDEQ